MLNTLCRDKNNMVFIVSSRSQSTLGEWFASCEKLGLTVEHECFLRLKRDEQWEAYAYPDFGSCQAKELLDHLESVMIPFSGSVGSGVHPNIIPRSGGIGYVVVVVVVTHYKCLVADKKIADFDQVLGTMPRTSNLSKIIQQTYGMVKELEHLKF
ncbi:alpha,alpha-trehalose-phosphate synthase [UDP-forming] 6-like protein [Tanacetum coccineum]